MSTNSSRRKRSKNRKKENKSRHTQPRSADTGGCTSRDRNDHFVSETSSSATVPSPRVESQIPVNRNQHSPSLMTQNTVDPSVPLTQSGGIGTHTTRFGQNTDLNAAAGVAIGAYSTAINNYHFHVAQAKDQSNVQVDKVLAQLQVYIVHNSKVCANITGKESMATPDKIERPAEPSTNLPRANAAYNDYMCLKGCTGCLEGTREALLKEIQDWANVIGTSRTYVLSGLAGIGKSTIAYTVAQWADRLGLLGASFFFSRNEAERRTAEKFFTTIASQLCAFDAQFSSAIQNVLATDKGKNTTTKDPETQFKALIVEPLQDLVRSRTQPVVIVIDALDECEDDDARVILNLLERLVHAMPSFNVLLTTRPRPHLGLLLSSHNVFHLHNIEDKIINGDIRRYLEFSLSSRQVQLLLGLRKPWAATDDDIVGLVEAAGKLFIIASISVLFILDKTVRNPASQMKKLRSELARSHTPLTAMGDFYSIILRAVVPPGSDHDIVERFQKVISAVVLHYDPLPVNALAQLIDLQEDDVYGVLDNLQSVILLGKGDIPYIYHKSFSDWIMDPKHCEDKDHRIDPGNGHTWLAKRCLQTMNERLKRNMLNIEGYAQFETNPAALKLANIEEVNIPLELQYACIYWPLHLHNTNIEDASILAQLKTFADNHLLHWVESLSWIGKIFFTFNDLGIAPKFLENSALGNLRDLFTDVLRFIFKFGLNISRSALFTYHSALPFTPTESLLYQRNEKEMMQNICRIRGGPKKWGVVIGVALQEQPVNRIKFGNLNAFSSFSSSDIIIWSSIGSISSRCRVIDTVTFANNFDIAAGSQNTFIFVYESTNKLPRAAIRTSAQILRLALSPNGRRLAAGLSDGTVHVWAVDEFKYMASFDGFGSNNCPSHDPFHLAFSHNGDRIAYRLVDGGVALRNEKDWNCNPILVYKAAIVHRLLFSPNGPQLASLVVEDDKHTLTLWDCHDVQLLGAFQDVGSEFAFSADGSLIVTGGRNNAVKLFRKNEDQSWQSIKTPNISSLEYISCLAFSPDGILAIGFGSEDTGIILYDVENCSLITTIPLQKPTAIAFSSDCTRLATGNEDGIVCLLDVPIIKASAQISQENLAPVSVLVFSQDCSPLASGSEDGIILIWGTNCASKPIASYRGHSSKITTLAFSRNGTQFASGAANGTIKLWSGDDWALSNPLERLISGEVTSVAVSAYLLAGSTTDSIALWDLRESRIDRLGEGGSTLLSLSNDDENLLLASLDGYSNCLTVWDVGSRTPYATFSVQNVIERPLFAQIVFLPHNSHVCIHRLYNGRNDASVFNIDNKMFATDVGPSDVFPCWKGIPVYMGYSGNHYIIGGWFSQGDGTYAFGPVCLLPDDLDVVRVACGSSMFAVFCKNGDLILLQSN